MRDIEKYEKEYEADDFEFYQAKYRKKKILETINKYPHKSILEIGCGLDPFFNYVDDYGSYTFFEPGKEFFSKAVQMAGDDKRITGYNDSFFADDRTIDSHFDMIICSSLLHELENPEIMVEDIVSICDEDTVVHINVPNANSFHRLLAKKMGLINDVHEKSETMIRFQRHHVYDIQSLKLMLKNCGLSPFEEGGYFIKPFTHKQMYKMLQENIIIEKTLDGLYDMADEMGEYGSEIFVNCRKAVQ